MARRKINPAPELALITAEKSSVEHKDGDINLVLQQIGNSALYSGDTDILTRAGLSWAMLTDEEKHEYSRRAFSLSVNGFDLFIYDYICLSGTEPDESIKAMFQRPLTKH